MMPTNLIAAATNPQSTTLPNLARRGSAAEHPEVNETVRRELEYAGIEVSPIEFQSVAGEVPTTVLGFLHQWKFRRAWYYYVADGPGIPPDVATRFHETWGTQCRVDGHCGCPPPAYCRGFAVGLYHIDTLEGLKAFAEMLRSVYKEYDG